MAPPPGASGAQGVISDNPVSELPATNTGPSGVPVSQVPTAAIASRPELMQFKQMDDASTGENANDRITANYDPIKAGNLLLWEPTFPAEYGLQQPNERYIVANGHHRDALAKAQNVDTQNSQILRESAGYSAGDARAIAAETNIADGKGTIYDQTKFIRNEAATHGPDAALERAGQIGARGRKAATIALAAEPDLYTSFVNEQITPEAAAAIAQAAPNDAGLQRLGLSRALEGDEPPQLANFLQAVKAQVGATPTPKQVDLFAADDSAISAAQNAAKRASAIQREINEQIQSVAGAAKRPEKAAALGVNVSDPASVNAKLSELAALRERARNWIADPEIRDASLRGYNSPSEVVARLQGQVHPEATPQLREGEKGHRGLVPAGRCTFQPRRRVGDRPWRTSGPRGSGTPSARPRHCRAGSAANEALRARCGIAATPPSSRAANGCECGRSCSPFRTCGYSFAVLVAGKNARGSEGRRTADN